MAVLMVENLILNPTRFNSGVFDNHEEDFPLHNAVVVKKGLL